MEAKESSLFSLLVVQQIWGVHSIWGCHPYLAECSSPFFAPPYQVGLNGFFSSQLASRGS